MYPVVFRGIIQPSMHSCTWKVLKEDQNPTVTIARILRDSGIDPGDLVEITVKKLHTGESNVRVD